MGCLAVLAVLALPFGEWAVARQVAAQLGWDATIWVHLASLALGASLARQARRRATGRLAQSRDPLATARAGFDVASLWVAEVLFWFPGLVSDGLALLLVLPPVRDLLAARLAKRLAGGGSRPGGRAAWVGTPPWGGARSWGGAPPSGGPVRPRGPIIDVEAVEVTPENRPALPPSRPGAGPDDRD